MVVSRGVGDCGGGDGSRDLVVDFRVVRIFGDGNVVVGMRWVVVVVVVAVDLKGVEVSLIEDLFQDDVVGDVVERRLEGVVVFVRTRRSSEMIW